MRRKIAAAGISKALTSKKNDYASKVCRVVSGQVCKQGIEDRSRLIDPKKITAKCLQIPRPTLLHITECFRYSI